MDIREETVTCSLSDGLLFDFHDWSVSVKLSWSCCSLHEPRAQQETLKNNLLNISATGFTTCPAQLGNTDSPSRTPSALPPDRARLLQHDVEWRRTGQPSVHLSYMIQSVTCCCGVHSHRCNTFPLHNLTCVSLMLKTEAMLRGRTIREDDSQLERVASRGGFVVFVALQGERGNANVKVGSVGPFDTKRPPHVSTGGL